MYLDTRLDLNLSKFERIQRTSTSFTARAPNLIEWPPPVCIYSGCERGHLNYCSVYSATDQKMQALWHRVAPARSVAMKTAFVRAHAMSDYVERCFELTYREGSRISCWCKEALTNYIKLLSRISHLIFTVLLSIFHELRDVQFGRKLFRFLPLIFAVSLHSVHWRRKTSQHDFLLPLFELRKLRSLKCPSTAIDVGRSALWGPESGRVPE